MTRKIDRLDKERIEQCASLVADFYNEGLGFDDFAIYHIWGEHRVAIAWCFLWYCGYVDREIPKEHYQGIWNAYAYIIDNAGLDVYNKYYTVKEMRNDKNGRNRTTGSKG